VKVKAVQYFLRRRVLGDERRIDLSLSQYDGITGAIARLLESLFIEEKLGMLLGNWIELEQHLLSLALSAQVGLTADWSASIEQVFTVNRRLVNLLSSCRVYIDHVRHSLSTIYGPDSQQVLAFKESLAEKYDSSGDYRAMEALRNYTQHRGIPVREIRSTQTLVTTGQTQRIRHHVAAYIHTEELVSDKDFKAKVAAELATRGAKLDMRPMWRTYVECLGDAHGQLRVRMANDVSEWEQAVRQSISLFQGTFGDDAVGLAAFAAGDEGDVINSVAVFSDFIERRKSLVAKTPKLDNLSMRYVSSEVTE
jgi:hypothetical protein